MAALPVGATNPSSLPCGTDQGGGGVLSPDLRMRDYPSESTVTMTANQPPDMTPIGADTSFCLR